MKYAVEMMLGDVIHIKFHDDSFSCSKVVSGDTHTDRKVISKLSFIFFN
jgi:hypothetical protein